MGKQQVMGASSPEGEDRATRASTEPATRLGPDGRVSHSAEPMERVRRPRQLVLHVTEAAYENTASEARERGVSKAVVLRELLNKGLRHDAVREALEDMCLQFAHSTSMDGAAAICTGGLSALEDAFDVLEWDDPHPIPWDTCDEPGCDKRTTCGFPTPKGYRRTCGKHYHLAQAGEAEGGDATTGSVHEHAAPEGSAPNV